MEQLGNFHVNTVTRISWATLHEKKSLYFGMFFLARLLWRGFPIIQEMIRNIMRGWRDAFRLNMYQQPLQNPSCKPISKQLHRGKTLYWRHLSSSYWQSLFYNDWQRATAKHRFYFRAVKHLLTRVLSVKSGIDQTFCFFPSHIFRAKQEPGRIFVASL